MKLNSSALLSDVIANERDQNQNLTRHQVIQLTSRSLCRMNNPHQRLNLLGRLRFSEKLLAKILCILYHQVCLALGQLHSSKVWLKVLRCRVALSLVQYTQGKQSEKWWVCL